MEYVFYGLLAVAFSGFVGSVASRRERCRIRLVVCHTAYIICDSGSICYFLQNIVSIAFSRNLCGTFS